MANRFVQRARKPNYTKEETDTLLDQLIIYGHFLFNKNQPVNNQQKADVWANIAMQVNSVPNSAGRTVDELKHRWQDMAQRARAALRKRNLNSPNDVLKGPVRPVPFLNKILQILGETHGSDANRLEESGLTSVDSTYSSDSSCPHESKQPVKEEIDNQSAVVDLSHSNGSRPNVNSMKRSISEITGFTPVPDEKVNNNSSTSPFPSFIADGNQPLSVPNNAFSVSNNENHQDRFESKRRRMKNSSSPRKSVSLSQYEYEPPTVQHQHIETFRSMVLDPDSQLVMEVEDSVGGVGGDDDGSQSSSLSASNQSIQDNQYDGNECFNDKGSDHHHSSWHQQLRLKRQQTSILPAHQYPANNNNQAICRNKHMLGLPFIHNNNNNNNSSFPSPTHHPGNQNPAAQDNNTGSTKLLESLSKSELDRQCVISQIRLQDQQTRYLLLKEKKLQLEIDLIQHKCSCRGNSSNANSAEELPIPSSSSPFTQTTNSFPTSPCHLSISSVTSFHSKTNKNLEENKLENVELRNESKTEAVEEGIDRKSASPLDSKGFAQQNYGSKNEEDGMKNESRGMDDERGQMENGDDLLKVNHSLDNFDQNKNGNCESGDDENNEEEEEEEDVSAVSFDIGKECDSSNINNQDSGLFGCVESKSEDWEKALQNNIGL